MTSTEQVRATADVPAGQRAKLVDQPGMLLRRLRAWAATTPGKLGTMLIGLVVGSLVVGVVAGVTMIGKQGTLDELVDHRAPMSDASQQVYRSLTDSEASAAAAFLASNGEAGRLRGRYQKDLERAGGALAVAAGDAQGAVATNDPAWRVSTLLPRYAGMLATAAARNHQGNAGASNLIRASGLLRGSMLGPAGQLYGDEQLRLRGEENQARAIPWASGVLVLLLLVGLVLTQRYVRRKTNRSWNVGLVLASVAVVAMLVWSVAVLTVAALHLNAAQQQGSEQVLSLSRTRLLAVQARGSENLELVARNGNKYEASFNDLISKLQNDNGTGLFNRDQRQVAGTAAASDVRTAHLALRDWIQIHRTVRQDDATGRRPQAIQLAVGDGARGAAQHFSQVDRSLGDAIDKANARFTEHTRAANESLTMLGVGTIVLGVLAAAGAAAGLWQRIREYR